MTERPEIRESAEAIGRLGGGIIRRALLCILAVACNLTLPLEGADRLAPITLHDRNPHYFLWRGKPAILITSGEHYGAVLNRAFNYSTYLETLQSHGFNLTRTFTGTYCEHPGAFNIAMNTLAPAEGDFICPWARSEQDGYANGGNKFDLTRWDPAYFRRLADFVAQASRRGIVVEIVLFCALYEDGMWNLSPMNARNNINGIGNVPRTEVYSLQNSDLLAVQEAVVRRIAEALKDCDNVYYEICNEPYIRDVPEQWQNHIAGVLVDTERSLGTRHLIAQNVANHSKPITTRHPGISIFNYHYAKSPTAVAENYHLNCVIGDDETGFAGNDRVKPYRLEGWDFILSGGAVYSNLDYSFAVGHEDGTAPIDAPGGGGPALRRQLEILKDFITSFDFVNMKPDNSVIVSRLPQGTTAMALVEPARAYAIYINGGKVEWLVVHLPAGDYSAEWVDTQSGAVAKTESFEHAGGPRTLAAPGYTDDIALRIVAADRQRQGVLFESDFEDDSLRGWRASGNAPMIVQHPTEPGQHALRSSLERHRDRFPNRTELSGPTAEIGKEYWYGFRIFLPEEYVPDRIWEIVAQWHAAPDLDIGEQWRNPIMALSTTNGRWSWVSRWDAKRNTFESGRRVYGGTKDYDLGPYERGAWTDWVVHVRWSYESDGLLEIWQNGRTVIDQKGPNAFNDANGPFFKMGIYKGWQDANKPSDAVDRRLIYHDEFRMGGSEASYDDVAPGRPQRFRAAN